MIKHYTIIPDFKRMGFELMAVNSAKIHPEILSSEVLEKAKEFIAKFPNTIFASSGEGMDMNAVDMLSTELYRIPYQSKSDEN